jgi:hypothetical protein
VKEGEMGRTGSMVGTRENHTKCQVEKLDGKRPLGVKRHLGIDIIIFNWS